MEQVFKFTKLKFIKTKEKAIKSYNQCDEEAIMKRLDFIADCMDSRFKIPFANIPFGFDSIIGLIPVFGDIITKGAGVYIIMEAHRLKVPKVLMIKMALISIIDLLVGMIPVAGDAFDFFWRSSNKNVDLLRKHLEERKASTK